MKAYLRPTAADLLASATAFPQLPGLVDAEAVRGYLAGVADWWLAVARRHAEAGADRRALDALERVQDLRDDLGASEKNSKKSRLVAVP